MKRNSARQDRKKRGDDEKEVMANNAPTEKSSPSAVEERETSSQSTSPEAVRTNSGATRENISSSSSSTTLRGSTGQTSSVIKTASKTNEAEDFFTLARAKGLNLTRQQYELARAGVSAFLRAERVANSVATNASSSSSIKVLPKQTASKSNESSGDSSKNGTTQSASSEIHSSDSGSRTIHRAPSNNNQKSTLSFFTAVLPLEKPDVPPRPRLDDIGSLEERRRRREKRRRMRERAEREANDADCETGSHSRGRKAASEPIEDSPLTGVGAYDTPIMLNNNSNRSPKSRALRMKSTSFDLDKLSRVGLGIMGESPATVQSGGSEERLSEARSGSPSENFAEKWDSITLSKLTKKAHVDESGRLTLLPSPIKDLNEELVISGGVYDELTANGGGETDDSGVCLTCESNSSQCKKPSGQSSSPSNRRRVSSFGSSSNNDLNDSMDKLSFLDRIMAQKKSPLRLRKEAKARERRERLLAANNDLIVMTATTRPAQMSAAVATTASNSNPIFSEPSINPNIPSNNDGKSVRWANDFHLSPRKRMTTKEMYDFEFYGIAPTIPETWEQGEGSENHRKLPNGNDEIVIDGFGHSRMRSHVNSTSFGSPIASRTSQNLIPDSPGFLSLAFHDSALQGAALLAKRGLLFGGSTTPGGSSVMIATPPVPSPHDGLGHELQNIFSQGPTLARSPARKGLIETETPPRLVRAKTLAAPISLAQSIFGGGGAASREDPSPQRKGLLRAHSSSVVEKKGQMQTELNKQKEDGNKENEVPNAYQSGDKKIIPAGWANRNASGRLDTISPAAIFGFGQEQLLSSSSSTTNKKNEKRVLQDSQRQNMFQQRARMVSNGSVGQFSASDIEGDDEHDLSPTVHVHGKPKKKKLDRHGRSHSSSNSSAYDDSPLMLDTRSNKATVVVRPISGNSLARALDIPNGEGSSSVHGESASRPSMEWDKPDGSRVVKLVSEELQAALDSGTLPIEPPARFYKYPSGWGKSKDKPQSVSYAGMIGQAILSSSDGRLSLNEIYNWISTVFPFFERGDRGWQNSIRHNLSLNKSFEKVERAANVPGKGGWWAIKEGHEERFRNGNYYAPGSVKAATPKSGALPLPTSSGSTLTDDMLTGESKKKSSSGINGIRRKRIDSSGSKNESDSDVAMSSTQSINSSTGKAVRKRVKKIKMSSNKNEKNNGEVAKSIPVPLLKPNQESGSSDVAGISSPKQYNTITPSRPYQPRGSIGTSSSDFGSVYASSTMAGMPMLTDASSPPSSPNNTMPPPPGGIRGAASTQSAQKQRDALMRQQQQQQLPQQQMSFQDLNMVYQSHNNLSMSSFISSTPFMLPMNNGVYSQHALPASPLAHMRGGTTTNHGVQLANGRLRNGVGGVNESPLRQSTTSVVDTSPSRLIVNSPPVSNVRGETGANSGEDSMNSDKENKHNQSPARFVNHSPVRGSPLRPGGALNQQSNNNGNLSVSQSSSSMMLSPAGVNLQMAFGGNGMMSSSSSSAVTSTPIMQRWGMGTSPLSSRLFSPNQAGFLTPNTHAPFNGNGTSNNNTPGGTGGGGGGGNGGSGSGLDDPFDYSGNLQHELDMASELHHLTSTIQTGEQSPIKGFSVAYHQHHQHQHPQQHPQNLTTNDQSITSFNPFLPSQG